MNSFLVAELRRLGRESTACELAWYLHSQLPDLTPFVFIIYFKFAFPEIPLRTVREGECWPFHDGRVSDDDLDQLFRPWIPSQTGGSGNRRQ